MPLHCRPRSLDDLFPSDEGDEEATHLVPAAAPSPVPLSSSQPPAGSRPQPQPKRVASQDQAAPAPQAKRQAVDRKTSVAGGSLKAGKGRANGGVAAAGRHGVGRGQPQGLSPGRGAAGPRGSLSSAPSPEAEEGEDEELGAALDAEWEDGWDEEGHAQQQQQQPQQQAAAAAAAAAAAKQRERELREREQREQREREQREREQREREQREQREREQKEREQKEREQKERQQREAQQRLQQQQQQQQQQRQQAQGETLMPTYYQLDCTASCIRPALQCNERKARSDWKDALTRMLTHTSLTAVQLPLRKLRLHVSNQMPSPPHGPPATIMQQQQL